MAGTRSGLKRKFEHGETLMHATSYAPPTTEIGWKQHFRFRHIYGLPDGRVWSSRIGRFLKGTKQGGYIKIEIDGKGVQKHRLNFEIATGRAIGSGMQIDHKISPLQPTDGSERPAQDDSWDNLQELSAKEHQLKTKSENSGGKKLGVTLGLPVIAVNLTSGEEQRFTSTWDAARALNVSRSEIFRRVSTGSSKEVQGYSFRKASEHLKEQEDRPGEVWRDALLEGRPIDGVKISTCGRILLQRGRRTLGTDKHGRYTIGLIKRNLQVHVLMAHTFLGPPPTPEHTTVDHINRDSLDNRLENLRWATRREQARNRRTNQSVHMYDLKGNILETYGTLTEAAEANSLQPYQVGNAARSGKVAGGFQWGLVQAVDDP